MTNHPNEIPGSDTPLDSWKEIAAYLQRDVSTAMRWEKSEELPVHRHQHSSRASVYAFTSELDAWKAARKPQPGGSFAPWDPGRSRGGFRSRDGPRRLAGAGSRSLRIAFGRRPVFVIR